MTNSGRTAEEQFCSNLSFKDPYLRLGPFHLGKNLYASFKEAYWISSNSSFIKWSMVWNIKGHGQGQDHFFVKIILANSFMVRFWFKFVWIIIKTEYMTWIVTFMLWRSFVIWTTFVLVLFVEHHNTEPGISQIHNFMHHDEIEDVLSQSRCTFYFYSTQFFSWNKSQYSISLIQFNLSLLWLSSN